MASKALTKEIRGIVAQKTGAVRKRMAEASTMERLVTSGIAPLGAGLGGLMEAYDLKIPIGSFRLPVTPIGAAVGIGAGLMMGKGGVGAGFLGFGIGQLDALFFTLGKQLGDSLQGNGDDDDEAEA